MLIARLGCFGPDGAALCNPPLERRLELQGERQCLRFELGAAGPIASLELHPGVGEGFFHLYRLAVGDSRGVHWERDPFMPGELDGLQLSGMVHGQSVIGEVFSVLETDASLRIPLPVTELGTGAWVEVELDCARGADFLIARDNFLREHARLREQVQTQAERILELEVDSRELAMVRRSRVWRAAEFLRRLIYLKLLSVVPSLQRRLLSATRGEPVPDAVLTPARKAPTVEELRAREHAAYAAWCARHDRDQSALREAKRSIASFARKPLISIIMPVYNMEPQWLERAIDSVKAQIYDNWELCVVDDSSRSESTLRFLARLRHPRMKIRFLKKNLNIAGATNEAIDMASGEYLGFMDNDDELAPDALFEIARAINDLDPDLMYSDEDFIDTDGKRVNPHFKPDFSPDLLLSHNYITHFCVLRRSLFDAAGPLQTQYDGAQDYALMLRATELTRKIHHIPRILYHWRMGEWSTSQDADAKPEAPGAARRALEDTLKRRGIAADILPGNSPHFFRVRRHIVGEPLVSIIIPFRDKPELLRVCVDSILQKSTWKNFEIVGVSNASEAPETFALLRELEADPRVRFVEYNVPFNFSRLVNFGVAQARGEYVVLLNNDMEIITYDWIEALLEHAQREEVGCVGGKLYFEDSTVQHGGIIIGIGGYAGHAHKGFPSFRPGYFNRLNVSQNISAVTGACLMIRRALYQELGGFNEEQLGVACNDVDFCLRVREAGYLNMWTPFMEAFHYESRSRGYEDTPEKKARFEKERAWFRERHRDLLERGDPYYNANLSLDSEKFELGA